MNLSLLFGGILGFLLRTLWDAYVKRRAALETRRLDVLERQLSEFYWPLYIRLQKDNAIWYRLLDRDDDDEVRRKVGTEIERSVILPNHNEIVRIVEEKMHLADADEALTEQLIAYVRHVAVFNALRASGVHGQDPIRMGEPWPEQLFPLIRDRTELLQSRYDQALETLVSRLTNPRWRPLRTAK